MLLFSYESKYVLGKHSIIRSRYPFAIQDKSGNNNVLLSLLLKNDKTPLTPKQLWKFEWCFIFTYILYVQQS